MKLFITPTFLVKTNIILPPSQINLKGAVHMEGINIFSLKFGLLWEMLQLRYLWKEFLMWSSQQYILTIEILFVEISSKNMKLPKKQNGKWKERSSSSIRMLQNHFDFWNCVSVWMYLLNESIVFLKVLFGLRFSPFRWTGWFPRKTGK